MLKINWGQLTEFPFNSHVWGTASDWIMILVTLATAVFLIKTFLEQKRANDILTKKERREIMPMFTLLDATTQIITLKLNGNAAFFVKLIPSNKSVKLWFFEKEVQPNKELKIFFRPKISAEVLDELSILIKFKDIDGDNYTQTLDDLMIMLSISYPKHHP